jgi:hypothetical protein
MAKKFTERQKQELQNIVEPVGYLLEDTEETEEYGATYETEIVVETGEGDFHILKTVSKPENTVSYRILEYGDRRLDDFDSLKSELREAINSDAIEEELEKKAQELANQHAAVFQSNVSDEEARDGVDMAVARYGSKIGVNGFEEASAPSLEGYKKLENMSTDSFTYNETVEVGEVVERASAELVAPVGKVGDVADDLWGEGVREIEIKVTGRIDRYAEV